jgi:hypothetical protein
VAWPQEPVAPVANITKSEAQFVVVSNDHFAEKVFAGRPPCPVPAQTPQF